MDKNFKIIGLRPSLLGDIITSLPVLTYLEKKYPNSYKTVSVAKKCSQIIPLLLNQPFIDRLHINEILENPNQADKDFFASHDLVISPNLEHPNPFWQNDLHMVEENFNMMGFKDWNILSFEERTPKLIPWFENLGAIRNKTIALFGRAGYNKDNSRSPSYKYLDSLVFKLQKSGYSVFQFGAQDEPEWETINERFNDEPFFDQIKMALSCSLMIGTDSGSSLIMGAYGFPQITLLTNWNKNHNQNFLSLSPRNSNNLNLFAKGGCDNINQELILDSLKLF